MSDSTLERLNARIAERKIKTFGEESVTDAWQEALMTRDGRVAYPVRDGIPVLLEDHGISLAQLND